jgi:hypothetical protein
MYSTSHGINLTTTVFFSLVLSIEQFLGMDREFFCTSALERGVSVHGAGGSRLEAGVLVGSKRSEAYRDCSL